MEQEKYNPIPIIKLRIHPTIRIFDFLILIICKENCSRLSFDVWCLPLEFVLLTKNDIKSKLY